MENTIKIKPIAEYQFSFDIADDDFYLEITEQELHLLSCDCAHLVPYGDVFKYEKTKTDEEIAAILAEETKQEYREKRLPLLEAWDILIGNINFGTIIITDETRKNLIAWRTQVLDLNHEAIDNPPAEILQFVRQW